MGSHKYWSPGEERFLITNYSALSISEMAEVLKRSAPSVYCHAQTLRRAGVHLDGNRKVKRQRVFFDHAPQEGLTVEKAYLLGTNWGDTNFQNRHVWCYSLRVTDLDFAQEAMRCLNVAYGFKLREIRRVKPRNPNGKLQYHIYCGSTRLSDLAQYGPFGVADWRVHETIFNSSDKIKASAIRGFADSEGCTTPSRRKGRRCSVTPRIHLSSTNLAGLQDVQKLLADLDIKSAICSTRQGRRRRLYWISITAVESCFRFLEKVGFTIRRKQSLLEDSLNKWCDFHRNRVTTYLTAMSLHHRLGWSEKRIHPILGVPRHTLNNWLYQDVTPRAFHVLDVGMVIG